MSLWSRQPFVAVRVLGPHGHYPAFRISTPRHTYVPGSELTWSAVVQPPLPEEWEVGETTALVPEEVRLYSAIALSEPDPWSNGRPIITNWASTTLKLDEGADLLSPSTVEELAEAVSRLRRMAPAPVCPPPHHRAGESYYLSDVGSCEDALDLLECIDTGDQLLLAGLARFLGATRLIFANDEIEEAAMPLFVSMGAALEFIRQHLCAERSDDRVSFEQVYEYLASVYPSDSRVAEYYEYMYEHRLAAIHPSNRDGEYWAPPLMADDVYHLQKHLGVLYRHIVCGEEPRFIIG